MALERIDKLPYLLSYPNESLAKAVASNLELVTGEWVYVPQSNPGRGEALQNRWGYLDYPERIVGEWSESEIKSLFRNYD